MVASPDPTGSGVGAFLRQLLSDLSQGVNRSLRDYQADFPAATAEVAQLYAALGEPQRTAPIVNAAGSKSTPGATSERILGDFRLVREVGRGGMGVVYEAEQVSLGRSVAVKVLAASLSLDPRARARFERESRLVAQLDHPGIAKVLAAHAEDELLYYAMEFVEGLPLDRLIQSHVGTPIAHMSGKLLHKAVTTAVQQQRTVRPRSDQTTVDASQSHWRPGHIEAIVDIAVQVADALYHAHQQGVIHRDVKPANILVRADGTAVLTDFGLARGETVSSLTATGDFLGTPFYVSPEQITAGQVPIDHRTDVYSLGVTLYELLTHRKPFDAQAASELKARILTKEPPRLQRFNPLVPHDLGCVVLKAMEKDPDRRYATAAAFAADLRAFLKGMPVVARPVPMWMRVGRWTRRNPLAAAFVGVLALATMALLLMLFLTLRTLRENGVLAGAGTARYILAAEVRAYPAWPESLTALNLLAQECETFLDGTAVLRESLGRSDLSTSVRTFLADSFASVGEIREQALPSLKARIDWASTIEARTLHECADAWLAAARGIKADPRYGGFDLVPMVGLVPIGTDPDSGLWEFADLMSGDVPRRDPSTRRLVITGESAIVFVALPGGHVVLGRPKGDPSTPGYDPRLDLEAPVQTVRLAPFLVSKFEIGLAQYGRLARFEHLAGRRSVEFDARDPPDPLLPVHDIGWTVARRILHINGMALPTEAQWEYACRAGTTTAWHAGDAEADLAGTANVADASAQQQAPDPFGLGAANYAKFQDGFVEVAPIGGRRPNAFGLHDMHGNVGEWCEDWFAEEGYRVEPRNGDGLRHREPPVGSWQRTRAIRGGSFAAPLAHARTTYRNGAAPDSVFAIVGVRACRNFPGPGAR